MKLASSVAILESMIKARMQEFEKLGREAKWVSNSEFGNEEDAQQLHLAMARIVIELKPVEDLVLKMYPRYENVFGALTKFYHEEAKKILSLASNL